MNKIPLLYSKMIFQTYGPKLVENIVQGTARDLLAEAMLRVEEKGYPIVMHCHDEIIAEVPEGTGSVDECDMGICLSPRCHKRGKFILCQPHIQSPH